MGHPAKEDGLLADQGYTQNVWLLLFEKEVRPACRFDLPRPYLWQQEYTLKNLGSREVYDLSIGKDSIWKSKRENFFFLRCGTSIKDNAKYSTTS